MKAKTLSILILGVLILLAGCSNQKELGEENQWRLDHTGKGKQWATNAEIVFEPDDKCSMTIYKDASKGSFAYKILVKDDTYDNYMVAVQTLDEGYTIEDLKKYPNNQAFRAPDYVNLLRFDAVDPGSTTFMGGGISIEEGELYFTCMIQGPDAWRIIGHLGPLQVKDPYAMESGD